MRLGSILTRHGRPALPYALAGRFFSPTPTLQIVENSVFLEKVLQDLDAKFQASAALSVEELRLLAQTVREWLKRRGSGSNGGGGGESIRSPESIGRASRLTAESTPV